MNIIGQNIRALRLQKGWSQQTVSKKLNISIAAFSKIETGRTDLNLSRFEQIAQLFNVTPAQLATAKSNELLATSETEDTDKKIIEHDAEIRSLRTKIIGIYDDLYHATSSVK
jgi:transcriptional regulator with XRE-family HTH domain